MKKILLYVFITFMLIFSCFAPPFKQAFASSVSDNSVIILSGNKVEGNKLVIEANLAVNPGISAMTLELSYNKEIMTLSNVVFGSALSSLNPITTNTQTSEGYSITPFKFNYLGYENDNSTGNLFTLTFDLSDNIADGSYVVTLKYEKNKDVNYFDDNNDVKTKNLFVDKAEITFKNNVVEKITTISESNQTSNAWIIVVATVVPTVVLGVGTFFLVKFLKRKRNWQKLWKD